MNQYLLQLLKEVNTIIIPGLGALTITNEATGEIMFMPYLKYDDGNLAKHISEKEGMELNDAKNLIAKFVREVTAELDKGNSYDMYQFGKFFKADGDVAFENAASATQTEPKVSPIVETEVKPEPPKVEVVEPIIETPIPVVVPEKIPELIQEKKEEVKEVEKPKEEPVSVVNPEKKEEPKAAETPKKEVIPEVVPDEIKAEKEEIKVAPIVTVEKSTEKTEVPIVETPKPEIKTENIAPVTATVPPVPPTTKVVEKPKAVKAEKAPKPKKEAKVKRKTPVLAYIIWGVIVLILGAGTYIGVNIQSLKKDFPVLADLVGKDEEPKKDQIEDSTAIDEQIMADEEAANAEPIPEEEIPMEEEIPTAIPEPSPAPAPAPKPVAKPKPAPVSKPVTAPKPVKKPIVNSTVSSVKVSKIDVTKPYHIIAGSFSSEANAKRLAKQLKDNGQTAVAVGQTNGMFRVSIQGFSTKDSAVNALPQVQAIAPGAWVATF